MVIAYVLENCFNDSLPILDRFITCATSQNYSFINPAYTYWNQTNNLLKSWIYNSISGDMLSYVSILSTATHQWRSLSQVFHSFFCAQIMELRD